ncbi:MULTISPECIES: hypothetical protein [unclassified Maridesulfovibrio]|uniref:Mom family adenine methylcarbamoylation protein n=1 Tax=unclassified Maridesulfovibrio TaxID=2794999 RepID=UPI003B3F0E5D
MARKPFHPPEPGEIKLPTSEKKGYIHGTKAVAGFGNRDYYVMKIPVAEARNIIIKHHYSHRIVNNSYVHLGVFMDGNLVGVLQFGYALNPHRANSIVADTVVGEYLELNRMWLSDEAPRNSESKAISYAIKYIKAAIPSCAWIQSFADERCGGLGVVYQASNFVYCGFHHTTFYELDGEAYHPMLLTAHKKAGKRGRYLRDNLDRAEKKKLRQFRYIYFIKKNWQPRLKMKTFPYPKPSLN